MKKVSLLHIGDIHFPNISKSADIKDPLPDHIEKYFTSYEFKKINECLLKEIPEVSCIVFSGDITTTGDLPAYKKWLVFFKKIVNDQKVEGKINIVPGNHDLERKSVPSTDMSKKFDGIKKTLDDSRINNIPIEEPIITSFEQVLGCKFALTSLNSCLGCGEIIGISEVFKEVIKKDSKLLQDYYTIDTPFIDQECIGRLPDTLVDDKKTVLIFLAHHNLLPNKRPRLKLYGEMLNSGQIRNQLLHLNQPVIYIHGHIHKNLIEVIHNPENINSKIICVSAPTLYPLDGFEDSTEFGFNIITLYYTDEGFPLGCEISYVYLKDSKCKRKTTIIQFVDLKEIKMHLIEKDYLIIDCLRKVNGDSCFISDISKEFCAVKGIALENIGTINSSIEPTIEKLSWLGLLIYQKNDFDLKKTPIGSRRVDKMIP